MTCSCSAGLGPAMLALCGGLTVTRRTVSWRASNADLGPSDRLCIPDRRTHVNRTFKGQEELMHVQIVFAAAVLAGIVEFACLCHEAPVDPED